MLGAEGQEAVILAAAEEEELSSPKIRCPLICGRIPSPSAPEGTLETRPMAAQVPFLTG